MRNNFRGRQTAGMKRRDILAGAVALAAGSEAFAQPAEEQKMFGLIGKLTVRPDQRDAFIAILMRGTSAMPGCLSYIIAKDQEDEAAVWVTEVWDNQASHDASLSLPSVKQAIAEGRVMITGGGSRVTTIPVGGHGLNPVKTGGARF